MINKDNIYHTVVNDLILLVSIRSKCELIYDCGKWIEELKFCLKNYMIDFYGSSKEVIKLLQINKKHKFYTISLWSIDRFRSKLYIFTKLNEFEFYVDLIQVFDKNVIYSSKSGTIKQNSLIIMSLVFTIINNQ